ncbi:tRNA (guanine(46)-N(7))-methyltransferase TrmB [Bartonella quintana]|uniref:tRNA (guanine-N(7)-)-methyltransferase n=3 Tax=Bartonella quintana TaxID=803 RepID=TRMB_BARQU|nr:tRNA (guanine(46)-N(7))-methyltransferase TrmB [Bartonella quintana]Q6G0N8.1 RecName: Full=tRNA (guanine-N(7)-)-methyltransferase; AltName: Full=tRNA (guanine(46)-N(7))-methyltransferase; AltName: Full=tRNA(m7G46)-methyltransferase [Bartonella quintana str. Toulouse]ETS13472.1 tRNA (guanine-N(7)-)-methyltransferase [Bartonella quintana BQ2-D70]ETS13868.1 tRNA (guanine-N(7)-)-methyltransferase [Bartonella quintana JK 73rel]ETS15555.1 tRNA (guanine-N(7)-)-methyltransferase [Bartonella quintana
MIDHKVHLSEAFFGRRKGKRLRNSQLARIKMLLPTLKIDLNNSAPPDLTSLFPSKVREVRLEIGFGGGEHLLHEMEHFPQTGFIGVEPFINGMAKMLMSLEQHKQHQNHLRLYDDDATRLLDWLPNASLDGIDLLYPDPWPKKKHWKRRFINMKNLNRVARVLKIGKKFRFATDIDSYANWTLYYFTHHHSFEWEAENLKDWKTPYPLWPGTRYEEKALREGRTPTYLTFIKK